jgi:hypothetical protein
MIKEQFAREIKKGTGKAYLLMKENPDEDFSELVFEACITHMDYDPQCSAGREEYLYWMVSLLKNRAEVEARILKEFVKPKLDYWAVDQMFGLAKYFALDGNKEAREAIYKKYDALWDSEEDLTGSYTIIELDKLNGLVYCVEKTGRYLKELGENSEDDNLIRHAEECINDVDPLDFLISRAVNNEYIAYYIKVVEEYKRTKRDHKPSKPAGYLEIKNQIESDDVSHFYRVRRMNIENLEQLAGDFKKESNEKYLENYLRAFVQVKYPFDYKDIYKYAFSDNKELRSWAIFSLKFFKNDEIRSLIDRNFTNKENLWETLHLLQENYRPSDIKYIEQFLKKEQDEDSYHSMAMSLETLVEKYEDKGLMDALFVAYDRGYCSNCRQRFIEAMIQLKALPKWITEEAIFDSDEGTRKIVRNYHVLKNVSPDATLLRKFFFSIEAKYNTPQPIIDEDNKPTNEKPIVGYFKTFGVTYKTYSEALEIIKKRINEDDAEIVEHDAEYDVYYDDLDDDTKSICGDSNKEGIWYESGRAMFPDAE